LATLARELSKKRSAFDEDSHRIGGIPEMVSKLFETCGGKGFGNRDNKRTKTMRGKGSFTMPSEPSKSPSK
jgi:hypothetical protein